MSKDEKTSVLPISVDDNISAKKKMSYKQATQLGIHSVKNLLGTSKQLNLFSDIQAHIKDPLPVSLTQYGIDLTDFQSRIMEGILRGFTETNYEGNITAKPVNKSNDKSLPSKFYQNITAIPRLKATPSQILEWSGIKKNSISNWERATDALTHLAKTPYCFYYERLEYDSQGNPVKDKNGKWEKEEVAAIGTLFSIKIVTNKKTNKLKYYEIEPSPIFLDQRENYFILIPFDWRNEVSKLVGKKRASSYTFRFLLFLRYQYEIRRRNKLPKEDKFVIRMPWEEIAIAIRMPKSIYKRCKKRALDVLNDAYSVAKELGYLSDYLREGATDSLVLNESKYYNPKELTVVAKKKVSFSSDAEDLFEFFHQKKKELDIQYSTPKGQYKNSQTKIFDDLLQTRSKEEIQEVIKWSMDRTYWCTQLGTPAKLRMKFGDAVLEMNVSRKGTDSVEDNKLLAAKVVNFLSKQKKKIRCEALNQYVEIGDGMKPIVIDYSDKKFRSILENNLRKIGHEDLLAKL